MLLSPLVRVTAVSPLSLTVPIQMSARQAGQGNWQRMTAISFNTPDATARELTNNRLRLRRNRFWLIYSVLMLRDKECCTAAVHSAQ